MSAKLTKNIYLVGYMGAGKSTLGKALAQALGYKFFDTDDQIENQTGFKLSHIFKRLGEGMFRQLEENTLVTYGRLTHCVIATGGGIMMSERNRNIIATGYSVFIDTPFAVCYERIKDDENRPLVKDEDEMLDHYEKRLPFYKMAQHVIVPADSLVQTCDVIIANIKS